MTVFVVTNVTELQNAIAAAANGDTITMQNGTYDLEGIGQITIDKAIAIVGESRTGVIITDSVAGGAATGLRIAGSIGAGTVTIDSVTFSGNTGAGIDIDETATVGSIVVNNSTFQNNSTYGVGSSGGAPGVSNVTITGSSFSNNGTDGATGNGDIILLGYNGNATISNVTIDGGAGPQADSAIQIAGFDPVTFDVTQPIGAIALSNVSMTGNYDTPLLYIHGYTSLDGLSMTGVNVNGASGWGYVVYIDPTSGATTTATPGQAGLPGFLNLTGVTSSSVDMSGVTASGGTFLGGIDTVFAGSPVNDIVTGTGADDLMFGGGGNDVLNGGGGADFFAAGTMSTFLGAGNDTYNGGTGTSIDTVTYDGPMSEYGRSVVSGNLTLTDLNTVGNNGGTDTLIGVDEIVFNDGAPGPRILVVQANGAYATIQAAVNAANDGDTIVVMAGTYTEQVTITGKALTIEAAVPGSVTLRAPVATALDKLDVTSTFDTKDIHAVLTVIGDDADGTVISGITVDGASRVTTDANGVPTNLTTVDGEFIGIVFQDASGSIANVTVTGMRDSGDDSLDEDRGVGIAVLNDTLVAGGGTVSITNSTVNTFQDVGLLSVNTTITMTGNTVTGRGLQTAAGTNQTGIMIAGAGAGSSVSGNIVTGIGYGPSNLNDTAVARAILIDEGDPAITNNLSVIGNTITGAGGTHTVGIEILETVNPVVITATNNTISNTFYGIREVLGGGFDGTLASIGAGATANSFSGIATNYTLANSGGAAGGSGYNRSGTSGIDFIEGNDLANTLNGLGGADHLIGHNGNDTYLVDTSADFISEAAGEGTDLVQSTALDYTLSANVENLTFIGASGNFTGTGNAGNNVITGGTGADRLIGLGGTDTLVGGAGNDTYVVDEFDTINETGGTANGIDTIETVLSAYFLDAPANIENLTYTGAGTFQGFGNSANNVIRGGALGDNLDGGVGGNDELIGNDGNDVLNGNDGLDTLRGGAGNDTLDGGTDNDQMFGEGGDDTYAVDHSLDQVVEGFNQGFDTVVVEDILNFDAVTTSYSLTANVEKLVFGGLQNFRGTGNALNNTIEGGSGDDFLDGQGGNDTMRGGDGSDIYIVNAAGDVVDELGTGEDGVRTSVIAYTLTANVENLRYDNGVATDQNFTGTGNELDNDIEGGDGNDLLDGLAGGDRMFGGRGNDTYYVDSDFDDVIESEIVVIGEVPTEQDPGGIDTVITSLNTYTLGDRIENATFNGTGAFTVTGNTLNNTLIGSNDGGDDLNGGDGDDHLQGLAGDGDSLTGGLGNDRLDGGAGSDIMTGGEGNDTYVVSAAGDVINEINGTADGIDTVESSVSFSLVPNNNIENLTLTGAANINGLGNTAANILIGNAGNNVLDGRQGNDTMTGGLGSDNYYVDSLLDVVNEAVGQGSQDTVITMVNFRLDTTTTAQGVEHLVAQGTANVTLIGSATFNIVAGNAGNNYLAGYGGNDTISGGAGNDVVFGGEGKDLLSGGTGNDNFAYAFIADSGGTQPRRDVISDFSQVVGNDDWIDLALTDANGAVAGNQAFTFIGTAAFSGAAGELRYFQDVANNRTIIEGNVRVTADSPGPELSIELTGLYTLTAGTNNTFDIIL